VLLFFHHLKKSVVDGALVLRTFFWCNKNKTQRLAMQEHNFDTLTKFFFSMRGGKGFFFSAQLTIF